MKELLYNLGKIIILISQIIFYSLQLLTKTLQDKVTNVTGFHLIGEKHDRTKRIDSKTKDDATFI